MSRFFDVIDWSRPWLAPFKTTAEPILQARDWLAALNDAASQSGLHNHAGHPLRFVPQDELPPGMGYEAFISATGCVPTRNNLHDFFNALVWLTFPAVKVRLNALQAAEIAQPSQHGTARRGFVRDAATIFDENAAILVVRDMKWMEALRAHHWMDVLFAQRDAFCHDCELWLFGHALMEKLVQPYKAITAHVWPLMADGQFFQLKAEDRRNWINSELPCHLTSGLTTKAFTPLPVLGMPGWWQPQDAPFYADSVVFRPKRLGRLEQ